MSGIENFLQSRIIRAQINKQVLFVVESIFGECLDGGHNGATLDFHAARGAFSGENRVRLANFFILKYAYEMILQIAPRNNVPTMPFLALERSSRRHDRA